MPVFADLFNKIVVENPRVIYFFSTSTRTAQKPDIAKCNAKQGKIEKGAYGRQEKELACLQSARQKTADRVSYFTGDVYYTGQFELFRRSQTRVRYKPYFFLFRQSVAGSIPSIEAASSRSFAMRNTLMMC